MTLRLETNIIITILKFYKNIKMSSSENSSENSIDQENFE